MVFRTGATMLLAATVAAGACGRSFPGRDHPAAAAADGGGRRGSDPAGPPAGRCDCGRPDGCCPDRCAPEQDEDCVAPCGDGRVQDGEGCDPGIAAGPGACPAACDDGDRCTTDLLLRESTCQAECLHLRVQACGPLDGCCPAGCTGATDADCAPVCGDGMVGHRERCDVAVEPGAAGACPTSCDDADPCSEDVLARAGTCGAACVFRPISACGPAEGCCPDGCAPPADPDCPGACGDGLVQPGEACDTAIAPGAAGACVSAARCSDGDACTRDTLERAGTCGAACRHEPAACGPPDGCCPVGCCPDCDPDCPAPARLVLSGDGAFGDADLDTAVSRAFTAANTGDGTATGIVAGALVAPFSHPGGAFPGGGSCGASLAAGATCTFVVTFAPTDLGYAAATVEIRYQSGAGPRAATLEVRGGGVDPVEH